MARRMWLICVLGVVAACSHWAKEPRWGSIEVGVRKLAFEHDSELLEIANGMRVAQVPDHRTNLVTVDVRYQVGRSPPTEAA